MPIFFSNELYLHEPNDRFNVLVPNHVFCVHCTCKQIPPYPPFPPSKQFAQIVENYVGCPYLPPDLIPRNCNYIVFGRNHILYKYMRKSIPDMIYFKKNPCYISLSFNHVIPNCRRSTFLDSVRKTVVYITVCRLLSFITPTCQE